MDSDDTAVTSPTTAAPAEGRGSLPAIDARFTIGALLGRGGMGEVRQAHDTHVDRDVAIKLMRGRPDAAARFLREARVQGRLDHPAIVPVYDLGTAADGTPYFVMKRLTGLTLHQVLVAIADGDLAMIARWPRRLLLARFIDVCLAVELAHTRGVIHRDLKPANIMDLMTRLLLQLPRELPPEVATAIEAERSAASRVQMRTASRVFVGFFLCVLLLFSLRIRVMWPVALMLALLAGAATALAAVARRPQFPQGWFDVALLYMVVLMAVTGIVVGPFQVVPIVVTGSLVAFLTQPSVQRPLRIVIVHVIMAGVPLLLELLGITPSTYYFANGAIHISPWVLEMSETGTTLSMVVTHWLLLGGIAMIVVRQRRAQEADHERIHLLKWQLHQILPSGHSGPRRAPA